MRWDSRSRERQREGDGMPGIGCRAESAYGMQVIKGAPGKIEVEVKIGRERTGALHGLLSSSLARGGMDG